MPSVLRLRLRQPCTYCGAQRPAGKRGRGRRRPENSSHRRHGNHFRGKAAQAGTPGGDLHGRCVQGIPEKSPRGQKDRGAHHSDQLAGRHRYGERYPPSRNPRVQEENRRQGGRVHDGCGGIGGLLRGDGGRRDCRPPHDDHGQHRRHCHEIQRPGPLREDRRGVPGHQIRRYERHLVPVPARHA